MSFLYLPFNVAITPKKERLSTTPVLTKLSIKQMKGTPECKVSPIVKPILIILDPGHGGHDVGTQSVSTPRCQEKTLNLKTALLVKEFLSQAGYRVWMTRENDTFLSLDKRAELANQKMPALFVSIHYNSAPSEKANGIEVFYFQSKEDKERANQSKRLAQIILKNVIATTKANSRGVKTGNYAVIRETKMPAILIEGGFVTNEEELQKLKDPSYLKKLAQGISQGIQEYFKPVKENLHLPVKVKGKKKVAK